MYDNNIALCLSVEMRIDRLNRFMLLHISIALEGCAHASTNHEAKTLAHRDLMTYQNQTRGRQTCKPIRCPQYDFSTMHKRRRRSKKSGSLFLSSLLLDVANSSPDGGGRLVLTRPVIFGLCHPVSSVGSIVPASRKISSTSQVKLGVIKELSGLGHILLVVSGLFGSFVGADLLVLCLGQSHWNIGPLGKLSNFEVLVLAGAVFIGVLDGFPEIEVGDLLEE